MFDYEERFEIQKQIILREKAEKLRGLSSERLRVIKERVIKNKKLKNKNEPRTNGKTR